MNTSARRSLPGSRLFTAGCAVSMLTGVAHSLSHAVQKPPAANPDEAELLRLLSGYVIPDIGRTTEQLMLGFSWWFSLGMFAPAALGLALRRTRPTDASILRTLAWGHTAIAAAGLAISLRYFFAIPTAMIGTALFCYAAAAVRATGTPR